jgi:hypothetical protein
MGVWRVELERLQTVSSQFCHCLQTRFHCILVHGCLDRLTDLEELKHNQGQGFCPLNYLSHLDGSALA